VLLTTKFLDVAKFITLTPLSLLISVSSNTEVKVFSSIMLCIYQH
jgi:hypothetical protein